MGTIADKLARVQQTKEAIRQAIVAKGQTLATDAPFADYAGKISAIPAPTTMPVYVYLWTSNYAGNAKRSQDVTIKYFDLAGDLVTETLPVGVTQYRVDALWPSAVYAEVYYREWNGAPIFSNDDGYSATLVKGSGTCVLMPITHKELHLGITEPSSGTTSNSSGQSSSSSDNGSENAPAPP